MTRITNFGRKRTYLEATSSSNVQDHLPTATIEEGPFNATHGDPAAPPKKKRKRTKPSMRDGNTGVKAAEAALEREKKRIEMEERAANGDGPAPLTKSAKKRKRESGKKDKALSASEWRRKKRLSEKLNATVCYACREKGHAAKDCPKAGKSPGENGQTPNVVGICYRCGSTKHTLSRCKKPVDQTDPLPFASCFVCNGKGHLASSCPQNEAKGVYPDGGNCKLCGDTSHLARDCGLRKRDIVETTAILGTGTAAGADEDDFHSFKRQKTEVDRMEKREVKSGAVKTSENPKPSLPPKKIVYF